MAENIDFDVRIRTEAAQLPQAIALLSQLDHRLASIDSGLNKFLANTQKMQTVSSSVGGVTRSFTELASALSLVERSFSAAGRVWGAFDAAGSYAISAMGQRTATMRAFTQLTGSRKQGELELYRGQQFSQKTDFTAEQIEKSQTRLMAQGFRDKELYGTLFAAADLASMMPGNKNETMDRITMALSQIKSKGKLQGEELTQQLAEAGLNTTLVKQELMKSYGLKSTQDVDKLMGKGGVSADVALPAIQRAILAQLGTTKAGEYSAGSAGSVTALISNRDEAIKNVLKGFDADEHLPAMERYKKVLTEQGKLFDLNSKTGQQLSLVMQDLANTAVNGKSAWAEFQAGFIESFADSYTQSMGKNGRAFDTEGTTQAMRNLGDAIGRLGSIASTAIGSSNGILGLAAQLSANVINRTSKIATDIGEGNYADALRGAGQNMLAAPSALLPTTLVNSLLAKYGPGQMLPSEDGKVPIYPPAMAGRRNVPMISKEEAAARRADAAGKSGREPYRGVFWAYQNSTGSATWAQPNISDVVRGQSETAVALTGMASKAGSSPATIVIQGYQKDKMDLARAVVSELGRLNRQAH